MTLFTTYLCNHEESHKTIKKIRAAGEQETENALRMGRNEYARALKNRQKEMAAERKVS